MKSVTIPGELEAIVENTGVLYLVVDRQENLDRNALYYHEVRKITLENGIQDGASISTSFNPAFEKLSFHFIRVTRRGVGSDRLDRSRIRISQSEKDADRSFYDSSYTAQTVLDDVRVGDVIEFACTTVGANPLKRGKYSASYSMQWNFPVVRNVLRLIYAATRKLSVLPQNGAIMPIITTANGVTELWYDGAKVPARKIEDDVPDGYWPRQRLVISEFHSWADLSEWAQPLFEVESRRSPELGAEAGKLHAIIDPEGRVVAALQFVQNEIRYVDVRSWVGAYRLTPPDEILRRRSASNIDRALLLVALLRRSGIDAAPAAVSDFYRSRLHEQLPSPELLDHVIVQVQLGEKTHWIDPSRSGQRGPLSQIYVGPYGYALVLASGNTGLVPFRAPPESWPVRKIIENFRIPPPENDADLEVISEYRGLAADRTRRFFRENTREEIQKRYLQFYTRTYPEAKAQRLPWYEEIPGENACRVTESYIIPSLWQLSDDKSRYLLYLQPSEVYSVLGSIISPQREDPLRLDYPSTVTEELNLQMFEDWPLDAKSQTIETNFFRVDDEPSATGSSLQLKYSYQARKDRVEVGEFAKFNEAINKVKDTLSYTLRYQTPEQLKKSQAQTTFNWAVGAAALSFLGTAIFVAVRYFRESRLPQAKPPPFDAPAHLNGIGGWLILLAIGHVLQPFRILKTSYDVFSATMNTNSWRSLTDPIESSYHAWWAPTLLFELLFNIVTLVFSALLIALFFRKRAAWPRAFTMFLVLCLVGVALDTILSNLIPTAAEPITKSLLSILPLALATAIWVPYVCISKRVKATFRF